LDLPYDEVVEIAVSALQDEGFGVLTEIDVQETLKEKLDVEFRRYVILGACNPPLAHKALSADLDVGLLLPCNVIVYEDGEATAVAIVDPISMLGEIESDEVRAVAEDARQGLERVIRTIANN
jgi:uncharacterized protein (DUF302 family)